MPDPPGDVRMGYRDGWGREWCEGRARDKVGVTEGMWRSLCGLQWTAENGLIRDGPCA